MSLEAFSIETSCKNAKSHVILRTNVDLVIGIPTVKRQKGFYITSTLQSIFENLDLDRDRNGGSSSSILVVVFVADTDDDVINRTIDHLFRFFPRELDVGLLEIVAPHPDFYPNMSNLRYLNELLNEVVWKMNTKLHSRLIINRSKLDP